MNHPKHSTPMRCFRVLLLLSVVLPVTLPAATAPAPIPLWPGTPPDETKPLPPEADQFKSPPDPLIAGRPIIRLGNVSTPTITIYRPDPAKDTGAAVVVCPGGGYYILAMDLEGTEVCEWLNTLGVTAVLLKYRVPGREGREHYANVMRQRCRMCSVRWVW
jgi:acetyl esterase/lipase